MSDNLLQQLEQAGSAEEQARLIALMTLESQPETTRRAAVAAAVPHWFDASVLTALLEDEPTPTLWKKFRGLFKRWLHTKPEVSAEMKQIYETLQMLPFTQRCGDDKHALHDLTRAGVIADMLQTRPSEFREFSRRAARAFAESDAIEAAYHLLASDLDAGIYMFYDLIDALCERDHNLNGAHRLISYLRELLDIRAASGARTERALGYGYLLLGDVQMNYASVSAAAESYQQSFEIRQRLAATDPANMEAQRDLSVSYNKLGDVQLQLGDVQAELKSYQQSLEIGQRLAAADPTNTQAQYDLSISYERQGNIQLQLGNAQKALEAYQQLLNTIQPLAISDPNNTQVQRELSIAYQNLGNVQVQLGDTQAALRAYQQSLEIRQRLAAADPANKEAQRDLSVSYNKLGDVQVLLGDTQAALKSYQQGLEVAQRIAAADPANKQAQRDLMISFIRLGLIEEESNQPQAALKWYQQALPIAERLAENRANAQAQRDLKILQEMIKELQNAAGEE